MMYTRVWPILDDRINARWRRTLYIIRVALFPRANSQIYSRIIILLLLYIILSCRRGWAILCHRSYAYV